MRATFAALLLALASALCARGQTTPVPLPPAPLRPEAAAGPTKVAYAVWIGDVTRIDSVAQTISASVVLALRWRDPQLAHAGPGAKQYALDDIWNPRVLIAN